MCVLCSYYVFYVLLDGLCVVVMYILGISLAYLSYLYITISLYIYSLSWHYGRCEDFVEKNLLYLMKSAEKALKNANFDDLYDYINESVCLTPPPSHENLMILDKILDNGINLAKYTLENNENENECGYIDEYLGLMMELDGRVKELLK